MIIDLYTFKYIIPASVEKLLDTTLNTFSDLKSEPNSFSYSKFWSKSKSIQIVFYTPNQKIMSGRYILSETIFLQHNFSVRSLVTCTVRRLTLWCWKRTQFLFTKDGNFVGRGGRSCFQTLVVVGSKSLLWFWIIVWQFPIPDSFYLGL